MITNQCQNETGKGLFEIFQKYFQKQYKVHFQRNLAENDGRMPYVERSMSCMQRSPWDMERCASCLRRFISGMQRSTPCLRRSMFEMQCCMPGMRHYTLCMQRSLSHVQQLISTPDFTQQKKEDNQYGYDDKDAHADACFKDATYDGAA